MKNLKSKISNMKPSHWVMVSLWILTLVLLFSFVGTVTGLNNQAKKDDGKGHWTFKLSDDGTKKLNKTGKVDLKPTAVYKVASNYKKGSKGFTADWSIDKFEAGKPTAEAKTAITAIAAVALLFFMSLTAAIFGTAFIKYKEKRKAGK